MNQENNNEIPHVNALPTPDQLSDELNRVKKGSGSNRMFIVSVSVVVFTALAVWLVTSLLLPVMRIYGDSMNPTLNSGDIVLTLKTKDLKRGDMLCFYYQNTMLCKRIIGMPGETVDIDNDGNVTVDGLSIREFYVSEKALGNCDIELPYTVPQGEYFVLGDNRPVSEDSRSSAIGTVSENMVVGKLIFRLWPFSILE